MSLVGNAKAPDSLRQTSKVYALQPFLAILRLFIEKMSLIAFMPQ